MHNETGLMEYKFNNDVLVHIVWIETIYESTDLR